MSRIPGPEGSNPLKLSPRTPGALGKNDAADPDSPSWLLGDTPGPLGKNDHADPTLTYLAGIGPLKGLLARRPGPPNYKDELDGANATLKRSADILSRICTRVRSDLPYWFARLYNIITALEIQGAEDKKFKTPAFVLHFIPIFYDLYGKPAEQFIASNTTQGPSQTARPTEWVGYFNICRTESPMTEPMYWLANVVNVLVMGVQIHIQSDMSRALVDSYRSFSTKYTDVPPFADLKGDFFDPGPKEIFKNVRTHLLGDLVQRCMRVGVDPEFAGKVSEKLNVGLNIDTIFEWRAGAWSAAEKELKKPSPRPPNSVKSEREFRRMNSTSGISK